jgi:Flp pilus assembly pilin Flp
MKKSLRNKRERGASLVEFALLVALIAVVAVGATRRLGRNTKASFRLAECLQVTTPSESAQFLLTLTPPVVGTWMVTDYCGGSYPTCCHEWFAPGVAGR